MLTQVTLSATEFKDLHNAKCDLYQVMQQLQGSEMGKGVAKELAKIERQIAKSLKNAYKQEDVVRERRTRHYDVVSKIHKLNTTIWSVQEIENLGAEHPYVGKTKLLHKLHWGKLPVTVEIEGNLWVDLWKAADKAILKSGDTHHCYIEGFNANDKDEDKDVLVLSTGS